MREGRSQAPIDSARHELALGFRILGWLLLAIDWLIVVFVPIGFAEGSMLWAWWFAIEAVAGIALVIVGYVLAEAEELPHAAHEPQQHRVRAAAGQRVATAN